MVRIGCLPLGAFSHAQCMVCIADQLHKRGHTLVFLGTIDTLEHVSHFEQFEKIAIAPHVRPRGFSNALQAQLAKLSGMAGVNFTMQGYAELAKFYFQYATPEIARAAVDLLLVDQTALHQQLIAKHLNIPYIDICCTFPLIHDPNVPPFFSSSRYSDSVLARWRNQLQYFLFYFVQKPAIDANNEQCQKWSLPKVGNAALRETMSPIAVLAQGLGPPLFDYARLYPVPQLHYIGRWSLPNGDDALARRDVPLPILDTDKRRVVYASFGTVQTSQMYLFSVLLRVCASMGDEVQLLLSTGSKPEDMPEAVRTELERCVKEYGFATVEMGVQAKLIPHTSAVVTHAGFNTAVMCLAHGKPMVAIPISNDHPQVAARIVDCGVGVCLPKDQVTEEALKECLRSVLYEQKYKEASSKLQAKMEEAGGVVKAADIIEWAIESL